MSEMARMAQTAKQKYSATIQPMRPEMFYDGVSDGVELGLVELTPCVPCERMETRLAMAMAPAASMAIRYSV